MVNFWHFLNATENSTAYTKASFLFCLGIVGFFVHFLDPDQLPWSLLEISSAAIYACINHYLHHYVQRYVGESQYLKSEIYAVGSLAVLLAPLAWLEFNTINWPEVNMSYTAVTTIFLCGLFLGYRRSGLFFNTLTLPNTAKFFIATTTLAVVLTGLEALSPLLVISLGIMAVSAYWSSLDPLRVGGSGESRNKLKLLLVLCATLFLFQCTMVVSNNALTAFTPDSIAQVNATRMQPLPLDTEYEFNRLICLRKVRERVLHEVGSRIRDGEPLAFMDFPMHSNLGDIFIWHGSQTVFEVRGQFPLVADNGSERNISNILGVRTLAVFSHIA